MEERIKELEAENDALRSCLSSVSAFEKEMHDNSLRLAKEIVHRDSKAVANIIVNMGFGNQNNVSFCEIFELCKSGGCENHKYCMYRLYTFISLYVH